VDEVAARLDTINYEVVTGVAARVPRIYLQDRSASRA
jgi:alanine racemase